MTQIEWFVMAIVIIIILVCICTTEVAIVSVLCVTALTVVFSSEHKKVSHFEVDKFTRNKVFPEQSSNPTEFSTSETVPVTHCDMKDYAGAIDYENPPNINTCVPQYADDAGVYHAKAHYYHDRSIEGHLKLKEKMDPIFKEELDDAEKDNGWYGNNEY